MWGGEGAQPSSLNFSLGSLSSSLLSTASRARSWAAERKWEATQSLRARKVTRPGGGGPVHSWSGRPEQVYMPQRSSPSQRHPRPPPCASAHGRGQTPGCLEGCRIRCELIPGPRPSYSGPPKGPTAHQGLLLPLAAVCITKKDVLIFGIWLNSLSSLTCGVAANNIIMEKPSESS